VAEVRETCIRLAREHTGTVAEWERRPWRETQQWAAALVDVMRADTRAAKRRQAAGAG